MYKFICIVGISGSGKSYYSEILSKFEKATIVSSDAIRKEVTGNTSDLSQDYLIWNKIIPDRILKGLLKTNVIFDATGVTISARRPIIDYADEACADPIECHYFEPDLARALKQNSARSRVIPEFVIIRQNSKWKTPAKSEGFQRIVNIDALIRKYGTTDFNTILQNEKNTSSG